MSAGDDELLHAVQAWLADRCDVRRGRQVAEAVLVTDYNLWRASRGEAEANRPAFVALLNELGFVARSIAPGRDAREGLALRSPPQG